MIARLLRPAERALDWEADRMLKREAALVTVGSEAESGMAVRGMVRFLFTLGALLVLIWAEHPVIEALTIPVLGWVIGSSAFSVQRRAHAYRRGWLDGRMRMYDHMQNHPDSPVRWINTEVQHDLVHVMGLPGGTVPDSPEGLN